jgi:diguanylate cyclase (GGDEF)-like protein
MLLDIDRFKVVNDSLGHAVGDELLRAVGGRLRGGISSNDVLGRFGGDEFVVIAPNLASPKDAEKIARRLERTLLAPIEIGGRSLSVSASIGVAVARADGGTDPDDLIRDADAAMYAAKRNGRSVRVFDASLRSRALDRLMMEEAVVDALENGWFELVYQPIVTMSAGTLAGVEALVRMNHPTLGLLPPDRFLPVAREVGLMGRVGEEVIRMAVANARRWNESFPDEPPLRISINLAESQAADPNLVGFVAELLNEHGVDPSQICFELSEDALVEHLRECVPVLKRLVALGVELSVDDFGTGRSSLAHLRLLSFVSEVKIDRTFVAGLGGSGSDIDIVGAIVDLAAALKARVVAEGVETQEQWERLLELGVSHAQGFFFARPQGAEVANNWAGDHGRAVGDRFEIHQLPNGSKALPPS